MPPEITMTPTSTTHHRTDRPLLMSCSVPGCTTLTMGGTCVEHDAPVAVTFPRGRPFHSASAEATLADVAPS